MRPRSELRPYNVFTDLAPISLVVIPRDLLCILSVPANSVSELVKLARSNRQINMRRSTLPPAHPAEMLKSMTASTWFIFLTRVQRRRLPTFAGSLRSCSTHAFGAAVRKTCRLKGIR